MLIVRAIRQRNIEIRLFLLKRIVICAVHAESKHPSLLLKDLGGAITLMNVQINHENFFCQVFLQEKIGADGDIVEKTKSCAPVCKGMVGPTRNVHGNTILQRVTRALEGAVHYEQLTIYYQLI